MLKCDGTRAETRFRLAAKRTSPFKSARGWGGCVLFSWLLAAVVCASAVVILETPCSEVVWRVLATHSIRQFLLHFPSRASPRAVTFRLDCTCFDSLSLLSTKTLPWVRRLVASLSPRRPGFGSQTACVLYKRRWHWTDRALNISVFPCHHVDRGSTVVKVLCYKSEGSWFDPSWCQWIFHWHKILPIALWPWGRLNL